MKTYAEVITYEAKRVHDAFLNGANQKATDARVIGYIYDVEERDVEIDIDDEYLRIIKEQGK